MSTTTIERLNTALSGRYRIERELGEGGMATVYLADDLKHERRVALKVLKPELAAVVGAERFLAEIKTTANLQHPHILPLFDSGEADSFLFYVMPYVQGESLRDRLDRDRQLPVDEAVRIATDVAGALQSAHARGVIHRDIKPANILLSEGRPLLADFGIALAVSAAGGGRMTTSGTSLGTPFYMSPEQASADRDPVPASDVYALACVLYETLVGEPPFTGGSIPAVLAKILTGETPSPTASRSSVPPNVDAAIRKALEKLPADRFESAQDFARALADPGFRHRVEAGFGAAGAQTSTWNRITVGFAAAVVVLAASTAWLAFGRGTAAEAPIDAPVVSFILSDATTDGTQAVGPDGTIAFTSNEELYLRRTGELEASRFASTADEFVSFPTFSPDGTSLAFVAQRGDDDSFPPMIKRVPVAGGAVQTIWSGDAGGFIHTPHWGDDGFIYFAGVPDSQGGGTFIWRVPEVGGREDVLLEASGFLPRFPVPLPGGRGLLFSPWDCASCDGAVLLLDLATQDTTRIIADGYDAQWSSTGHIVYAHRSGSLFALPFDPERLVAEGNAVPVLDDVAVTPGLGGYSLSRRGTLVYDKGTGLTWDDFGAEVVLVDAEGATTRLSVPPLRSKRAGAVLSPDGRSIAYGGPALIVSDLNLGSTETLFSQMLHVESPIWSPDGSRVAYSGADWDVYVIDTDRRTEPVRLGSVGETNNPSAWLDDGTVLFTALSAGKADVFSVPADASAAPTPVLDAEWMEADAVVSPDGEWIAYRSDRYGTPHFYVRPWPDLRGSETRVSEGEVPVTGRPAWSSDSESLFYEQGGQIVAATLDARTGMQVVDRVPLPVSFAGFEVALMDIHPDGRLLIARWPLPATVIERARAGVRRVVVTNWFTQLRERLGS